MEIANQWSQIAGVHRDAVRTAQKGDAGAITRLLREAPYSHIHADWHYPADWLGSPSFVILPRPDRTGKRERFPPRWYAERDPLLAFLAVAADPPPAAWVRLAAVSDKSQGKEVMAAMLSALSRPLNEDRVSQIAWLLVEEWPEAWLPELGFECINEVITYSRLGTDIPKTAKSPEVEIRPAEAADLAALAAIEARAFTPLWRHSELGLALGMQQALSFDVAWSGETALGFQFSSSTYRGAHLSRITVDPTYQRRGVGAALLAHALDGYARQGISSVTLNTQLDNLPSQRLYERFGFRANGERFPVWNLWLA